MRKWVVTGVLLAVLVIGVVSVAQGTVYFMRGDKTVPVDLSTYETISGSVAYQGPVMSEGDENWKPTHAYSGVSLRAIVDALGGLSETDTLGVVAADGWYKILPRAVVYGATAAGEPILASAEDGSETEDAPLLVFLAPDGRFSNDDMLAAFGPTLAHYFGDQPSTTGMLVKGVTYLVVDYDGEPIPLPPEETAPTPATVPSGTLLTLVKGEATTQYTLADLEALDVITAPGTFTNSAGTDYTATYTGVPLTTLVGNVPADTTVRVTASDGYSMNYAAGMLADRTSGTWILAFKENGNYMPLDPGYLRIVEVGEDNPHFTSALSARMVEQIEVLGTYEPYTLLMSGAVERTFTRAELEAGVGCPCHTATISVTSKGETHSYTGLPLWRLVGYVDDDTHPAPEQGIHYDDVDFNDALAATDYEITLTASDGYTQTLLSSWIARDDRFIVAFKEDGTFLDPGADGYMRFVYDDSVVLPEGARLKSVKFLSQIALDL